MKCPFCAHPDTQVIETRTSDEGDALRRRRRCMACDRRFTTYERAEIAMPVVVKRNGNRSDYDPAKLRASFNLALRKRPVSTEHVEAAVDRIEDTLRTRGDRETTSQRIGELVMAELRQLDLVAYVRFASVYKDFDDVDAFTAMVSEMRKPRRPGSARRTELPEQTAAAPGMPPTIPPNR